MYDLLSHRSRAFKLVLILVCASALAGSSWAATFTVTKIEDTNDGICDADCSLREAVAAAGEAATDDVIVFDSNVFSTPRTIVLSGTEIAITSGGKIRIEGPGASLLTISGNNSSGVLSIRNVEAEIDGVTISDGNLPEGYGGGISSLATLTLSNSIVTRNSSFSEGGGINSSGRLYLIDSVVTGNTSGWGGGIANNGLLSIERSTISGNSAVWGGGIANFANMTVVNSTISGNLGIGESSRGGGIFAESTVGFSVNIENSTVAFNQAAMGGGVFHTSIFSPGKIDLRNSIVSNNTSTVSGPDFHGPLDTASYNLIGDTAATMFRGTSTGNILGEDPMLDPRLLLNGGSTPNHALRRGSPAIDAGLTDSATTDQRGFQRPFDFPSIPNASGGDGSDIGAFERQADDVSGLAFVSISGRVMSSDGRGIRNATVTIFNGQGFRSTVITSSLGYYTLENVPADAAYTIEVDSKRYNFSARDVMVDDDLSEMDFVGSE